MISLLPDLTCDAACLEETLRPGRVRLPVALTHDSHDDSSDTMLGKHGLPREPSKHVMTPQRGEKSTGTNRCMNDQAAEKKKNFPGRRGAVVIDDSRFPAAHVFVFFLSKSVHPELALFIGYTIFSLIQPKVGHGA